MDSRELQRAARWKYEQGRALLALPAALAALALVLLSYPLGSRPDALNLVLGGVLVLLSFHSASRGGPFSRAVFPALGAALLPMSLPPLAFRLGAAWWRLTPEELCLWACLFSGAAAAGLLAFLTRRVDREPAHSSGLLRAAGRSRRSNQLSSPGNGGTRALPRRPHARSGALRPRRKTTAAAALKAPRHAGEGFCPLQSSPPTEATGDRTTPLNIARALERSIPMTRRLLLVSVIASLAAGASFAQTSTSATASKTSPQPKQMVMDEKMHQQMMDDLKRMDTQIEGLKKAVTEERKRGMDPAHHEEMMKQQKAADEEIAKLQATIRNLRGQLEKAPQYLPQANPNKP